MPRKRTDGLKVIEVLVTPELRDLAQAEAELLGLPRPQFIALALEKYCGVQQTIRDLGFNKRKKKRTPKKKKIVTKPESAAPKAPVVKSKPAPAPVITKDETDVPVPMVVDDTVLIPAEEEKKEVVTTAENDVVKDNLKKPVIEEDTSFSPTFKSQGSSYEGLLI